MHAQYYAVVAGLRAAQHELWAYLRQHEGHQRGNPRCLIGMARREGWRGGIEILGAIVIALNRLRRALVRALIVEVVLLRHRGIGQSACAGRIAIS